MRTSWSANSFRDGPRALARDCSGMESMMRSNCAAVIFKSPTETTTLSGGTTGIGLGFSALSVTVGRASIASFGGGVWASTPPTTPKESKLRKNVIDFIISALWDRPPGLSGQGCSRRQRIGGDYRQKRQPACQRTADAPRLHSQLIQQRPALLLTAPAPIARYRSVRRGGISGRGRACWRGRMLRQLRLPGRY